MFDIRHHAVLDSTNEEAKRLADAGAAHGTVIWADEQTAGHGRFGFLSEQVALRIPPLCLFGFSGELGNRLLVCH